MKVKGSFDPKALTMKFADQTHLAKDAGSYKGDFLKIENFSRENLLVNRGGRKFDV